MRASELIEGLAGLISAYGNLDVYLTDWNEAYCKPGKATSVKYSSEMDDYESEGKFVIDV